MKSNRTLWRAFGVPAIIALIGFGMAACDNATTPSPNFNHVNLDGTWLGTGAATGVTVTISGTGWSISGGIFGDSGTFNRQGDIATLNSTVNGNVGTARIVSENRIRLEIEEGIFYFDRGLPGEPGDCGYYPCECPGIGEPGDCGYYPCECPGIGEPGDCGYYPCECPGIGEPGDCGYYPCECPGIGEPGDCGYYPCECPGIGQPGDCGYYPCDCLEYVPAADLTALNNAIDTASGMLYGVIPETNADNVPPGAYWATQAAIDAITSAIAAAEAARDYADPTQATIDSALTILNDAIEAFKYARRRGTTINLTALNAAITKAQDLLSQTSFATSADAVSPNAYWATQAAIDAITSAIAAAARVYDDGTTQATISAAVAALNTATAEFEYARRRGTPINLSALNNAITTAEPLLVGIVPSDDGIGVTTGFWAPQAAITAFTNAITTARGVRDNPTTMAAVNSATADLGIAQAEFLVARQPGTYIPTGPGNFSINFANFQNPIPQITGPTLSLRAGGTGEIRITGLPADASVNWLSQGSPISQGTNLAGGTASLALNWDRHDGRIGTHLVHHEPQKR